MNETTLHNPDRYMADLRQILSLGRKRVGLLLGAGAPVSVCINDKGDLDYQNGNPLIPDVNLLTASVIESLEDADKAVIDVIRSELSENPNIETILTRVRQLSQAIGNAEVHGLNGEGYGEVAERICKKIGDIVAKELPESNNPFTELISWIGGTQRDHPVEIFTPNYDLLLEEAFERAQLPYFDGFSGAHRPFFDPASISEDSLPVRWSRVWKIHGSLGWEITEDSIIRTGNREATKLIYPEHLKYDQISRQPYSALFERLRKFLATPDSILLCTGFSFFDAHITAILDEALAGNTHTAIFAFQYRALNEEKSAVLLALRRPNLSVYARDGAVIHGVSGKWKLGKSQSDEWWEIRHTFWKSNANDQEGEFLLGDFAKLARFFALAQASELKPNIAIEDDGLEIKSSASSCGGDADAEP